MANTTPRKTVSRELFERVQRLHLSNEARALMRRRCTGPESLFIMASMERDGQHAWQPIANANFPKEDHLIGLLVCEQLNRLNPGLTFRVYSLSAALAANAS